MTTQNRRRREYVTQFFVASLLSSTALTGVAAAQTANTQANVQQEQEIIVTATKRAENIQNVPLSIQALGTQTLDQHQVESFDAYANLLPSVSFQSFGPGQATVAFRGVTSSGDGLHIGSQPTSSVYLDDTPVTTVANNVDLHIYDVARIEALSGPQGTLFGASSLSGVLRIITNQPDPKAFAAGYQVEANYYTDGDPGGIVQGYINLPLSERMALRVMAFKEHDGGYIDNTPGTREYQLGDSDPNTKVDINNANLVKNNVNSVDTEGLRAALRINLNEDWTSTTSVTAQNQVTHGPFLFDPRVGDLKLHDFQPTRNKDNWWLASETITGRLGNFDAVYSGSYFQRDVDNVSDYSYYTVAYDYYTMFQDSSGNFLDPSQTAALGDHYTKQSHEFRINSPAENRFRFTLGVFYQTQRDNVRADYTIVGAGAPGATDPYPDFGAFGYGDDVFFTRVVRNDEDKAVFGDASFDVTSALTVSAGIRSFHTENNIYGFSGTFGNTEDSATCLPTTRTDIPCVDVDKRFEQSGNTYKVSAQYHIDAARMIYATYSTGYRPGGSNRRVGVLPFLADTIDNYEVGAKTMWFDNTLRFNFSIFDQQWKNLQFGLPGPNGVTSTYNAGSAELKGVEADSSWYLGQWTLSGSAAYIDSQLTSDFCQIDPSGNPFCAPAEVPAVSSGTRLPVTPRFKGTATARYDFTWNNWASYLQGTVLHQDGTRSFLLDADEAAVGPTKGFTTVDFSMGTTIHENAIELYIHNLSDERGILSHNTVCVVAICGAYAREYPIQPRIVGIRVSRDF
ncbi:MAG: TonB-dependent receptor [Alphaproteobacteria bacterium]